MFRVKYSFSKKKQTMTFENMCSIFFFFSFFCIPWTLEFKIWITKAPYWNHQIYMCLKEKWIWYFSSSSFFFFFFFFFCGRYNILSNNVKNTLFGTKQHLLSYLVPTVRKGFHRKFNHSRTYTKHLRHFCEY